MRAATLWFGCGSSGGPDKRTVRRTFITSFGKSLTSSVSAEPYTGFLHLTREGWGDDPNSKYRSTPYVVLMNNGLHLSEIADRVGSKITQNHDQSCGVKRTKTWRIAHRPIQGILACLDRNNGFRSSHDTGRRRTAGIRFGARELATDIGGQPIAKPPPSHDAQREWRRRSQGGQSDGDGSIFAADYRAPGGYVITAWKDGISSPPAATGQVEPNQTARPKVVLAAWRLSVSAAATAATTKHHRDRAGNWPR